MVLINNQIIIDTKFQFQSIVIDVGKSTRWLNNCISIKACANKQAANGVGCKKGVVSKPCHDCCDKDLCNNDKFNLTVSGKQLLHSWKI